MSASYPTSTKSFSTKTTGQTIAASHIDDLQDEVVAIEADLRAGLPVTRGGTGALSLAAHGVVVGNGTSAVSVTGTGTSGQALVSNGASADPTFQAVGVAGGGTGASSLTAHGVVIGNGTSAVAVTAAGTAGQLLVGATGADPAFAGAAASGASLVLLKANSGSDTSAGATNVDTVAITGLTALDRIVVEATMESVTQATGAVTLRNDTDSATMMSMAGIAAGEVAVERYIASVRQNSLVLVATNLSGYQTTAGANQITSLSTFSTNWTGSWTLALRHAGVTGGGTFRWKWAVYKLAGQ